MFIGQNFHAAIGGIYVTKASLMALSANVDVNVSTNYILVDYNHFFIQLTPADDR